jgi:hypothetical protein
MPDSDWEPIYGQQRAELEQRLAQDKPPEDGFVRREEKVTVERLPVRGRIRNEYEIWSSTSVQPPPVEIYEMCSKCGEHTHRTEGPIPPGASTHVPGGHFGERWGLVYQNARVRGKEYRRVLSMWIVTMDRIPVWFSRTIDHIRNGVDWLTEMTRYPCVPEGEDHKWPSGRGSQPPPKPEPWEPV